MGGVVVITIFINLKNENQNNFNLALFLSLLSIYLLSLAMFALTGMYTQSSFNLGNRVTIYFCIVVAYLIILIRNKYFFITLISLILSLTLF